MTQWRQCTPNNNRQRICMYAAAHSTDKLVKIRQNEVCVKLQPIVFCDFRKQRLRTHANQREFWTWATHARIIFHRNRHFRFTCACRRALRIPCIFTLFQPNERFDRDEQWKSEFSRRMERAKERGEADEKWARGDYLDIGGAPAGGDA